MPNPDHYLLIPGPEPGAWRLHSSAHPKGEPLTAQQAQRFVCSEMMRSDVAALTLRFQRDDDQELAVPTCMLCGATFENAEELRHHYAEPCDAGGPAHIVYNEQPLCRRRSLMDLGTDFGRIAYEVFKRERGHYPRWQIVKPPERDLWRAVAKAVRDARTVKLTCDYTTTVAAEEAAAYLRELRPNAQIEVQPGPCPELLRLRKGGRQ